MTMYEKAKEINADLVNLFNSLPMAEFSLWQKEQILNILIRFGRVAKFRCRSNSAYKNFVSACLEEVAELQVIKGIDKKGNEYESFRASIKGIRAYFDFLKINSFEDNKENFLAWSGLKLRRC